MFLSRHSIVGISKSAARNQCGLNNTCHSKNPGVPPTASALVGGARGALLERRAGGGGGVGRIKPKSRSLDVKLKGGGEWCPDAGPLVSTSSLKQ